MANEKKTYNGPAKAPNKKPAAHIHPDEWLHEWHHIVFPLRNGTTLPNYKPKIEKYIKDWLDLLNDITPDGKKYKLKDFEFLSC